ncbi:Zinc finger CCCH domain-containing protein 24 [Linum perenne]
MASPQSLIDQLPSSSPLLTPPPPVSDPAPHTTDDTPPPVATTVDDSTAAAKRKRDEDPEPQAKPDPSLHPYYKTSLCSYFRRDSGSCSHGTTCRYAHSEEELRPRPDKTWDPTSERAKKSLKLDNESQPREDDAEKKEEKVDDIMMTDMIGDEGDANGGCLDVELSKCLVHLPRNWSTDQLNKFLTDQGVAFKSAKKKKGMTVGFVSFENVEQLTAALPELEGKSVSNKRIKVADVVPRSYDNKIKSAMDAAAEGENGVVSKSLDGDVNDESSGVEASNSKAKCARDVVTPLAHMSYENQLVHKKNSVAQMLKKLTRHARKACPAGVSLPDWVLQAREIGGLPCKLEDILDSPLVNGYRNKCEFSVGYSLGGKPTVGFMLGNFREGVTAVEEPVDCPNVSSISSKYALIFQEFLQQSSLPLWNRFKNTGFWRQLTVREGRLPGNAANSEHLEANISEVMLMVQVSTKGFDEAIVTSELEKMAHSFTNGAVTNSPPLPLTALVLQDHQGISNVAPADAPLRTLSIPNVESGSAVEKADDTAEPRIHDHISNLRFSISPTAFFQVNTLAAEKLYALAGDWADLGPDTLLFDICCGTGTIGLTLAHRVGMVVGIEMNASAVSDANRNAEINGIKNCRFVAGKAEHVIGSLLQEYLIVSEKEDEVPSSSGATDKEVNISEGNKLSNGNEVGADNNLSGGLDGSEAAKGSENENGEQLETKLEKSPSSGEGKSSALQFKNIVAIVDPPRNGLHPTVIKALRTHSGLRRLVYISCNPETLVANAIELCTPSPADNAEKGNKNNRGWRNMSNAGLARHRAKSMPISEPFKPVRAMAVDLFPHTPHCEMVMLLER